MDVGLGLGGEPHFEKDTSSVLGSVIFAATERYDDVVLDDVVQLVLAQPVECFFLARLRDRCRDDELARHRHTVHVDAVHAHGIHDARDQFCRKLLALLLQGLEAHLGLLDPTIHGPQFSDHVAQVAGFSRSDFGKRVGLAEDVVEDIAHEVCPLQVCG